VCPKCSRVYGPDNKHVLDGVECKKNQERSAAYITGTPTGSVIDPPKPVDAAAVWHKALLGVEGKVTIWAGGSPTTYTGVIVNLDEHLATLRIPGVHDDGYYVIALAAITAATFKRAEPTL